MAMQLRRVDAGNKRLLGIMSPKMSAPANTSPYWNRAGIAHSALNTG
jgi:hypothetical protein